MKNKSSKPVDHYFTAAPNCDDRFGVIKASLRGRKLQFLTSSSVFSKKRIDLGTRVLIDAMVLPQTGAVLDIGCGFHPCAFPFMGFKTDVLYRAGDIDNGTMEVVSAFFRRLHVHCVVRILDAADKMPEEEADVAFLFKLVPVLEQQKKGLAYRLIQSIHAKTIVITFPIRSLSGRAKDMEQYYSSQFEQNLPDKKYAKPQEVFEALLEKV